MKNKQQNQTKQSGKTSDCGKNNARNNENKAKQNTGNANRNQNNRQNND